MIENRTPRDTMADQRIRAFAQIIGQHPGERSAQRRIRTYHPLSTHASEELGHVAQRING